MFVHKHFSRYAWFCKWHVHIFASLHFLEMGQLVFHLLQEWIGINRLHPSFIVWKKKNLIWIDSFRHLKGYIVPHLISMKIQIWKIENNFGLATFYGYFTQKHVLQLVPGCVGLGHIYLV